MVIIPYFHNAVIKNTARSKKGVRSLCLSNQIIKMCISQSRSLLVGSVGQVTL